MIMNNDNKQVIENNVNPYQRKPVKTFKSDKGQDRVRDRKDKRLYELEEDEDDGIEEKRPSIL